MDLCNTPDMVSHPPHYQSDAGLEVIDVIKAFTADLKGIEATDTGNIIKYICRWKHKNGLEDLKKARWYLNHLINIIENEKTTQDMVEQAMVAEDWNGPNTTVTKTKRCIYARVGYNTVLCYGTKEKDLCPGYDKCDRYKPIDD